MSSRFETVTFPAAGNHDGDVELYIAVMCEEEGEKWECLAIKSSNLADRVIRNTNLSRGAKRQEEEI